MEPLMQENSIVIVFRGSYGIPDPFNSGYILLWKKPDKNDIIVFHNPVDGSLSVKRCAGVPGDELSLNHSTYYLNDNPLPEPPLPPLADFHDGALAEGWYFLVGDNYSHSIDSRTFGPVPTDLILGRVIHTVSSNSPDGRNRS